MAWNAEQNTWAAPAGFDYYGTEDAAKLWGAYKRSIANWDTLTAEEKSRGFYAWWNGPGAEAFKKAWNEQYYGDEGWNQTWMDWQNDPDVTGSYGGTAPEALDLSGITAGRDERLSPIQAIMEQLAAQLAASPEQYNEEWGNIYAPQAGFENQADMEAWLREQRTRETSLLSQVGQMLEAQKTGEVTPEQAKMIRQQQAEMEAKARKQAEAMFQETGSYAQLQRASDEINRSSMNDAMKQQMDMALQNFSMALQASAQQSDIIARQVEAGSASFLQYVQTRQQGVASALESWEQQTQTILEQAQQDIAAAQAEWGSEFQLYQQGFEEFEATRAALNLVGDRILAAAAAAMGGADASEAAENFFNEILAPFLAELDFNENFPLTTPTTTNPTGYYGEDTNYQPYEEPQAEGGYFTNYDDSWWNPYGGGVA